MAQMVTSVDMVDLMKYATLTVKFKRANEMRFRTWLAVKLLTLTSWILNCNIEFDNKQ